MQSRARIGSLITALVVLATSLGVPSALAADSQTDIPGVPLPAPIVSGQLGGPIYDVVYRLNVPPGHVILAGLTGSVGTDFDLYLFDGSASTVLSNTGLLAKSNGPTSSEAISWPTRLGGTFYVNLNGATDVQGTYRLSVQVVPDPTPPTATLRIAGGATRVNTQEVTLQLVAFDDLSGVTEMSLSGDGISFLPPVPLQSQFPWILSDGDGPKRIWVRVSNGTGLVSAPASVSVVLDTTGPDVESVEPPAGSVVVEARPTVAVRFNEAIDASTWRSLGVAVQAPTGGIVPGEYVYYPSILTGTFTPSVDLAVGFVYVLNIGDVRDVAGNPVRDQGPWTIKRQNATAVSLSAKPSVVTYGQAIELNGTAIVPSDEQVVLESKAAGAEAYTTMESLVPVEDKFRRTILPATNTWYRARYPGSTSAIESSSADVRVLVRRKVVVAGPGPSTTRTAVAGTPVVISAMVVPAGATRVSFQLYRFDTVREAYRYAGSFGRTTDPAGRASVTWTPSAGRFYWRVAVLPTVAYANNTTAAYRWTVRR